MKQKLAFTERKRDRDRGRNTKQSIVELKLLEVV